MIGEKHQHAADEIAGARMAERPGLHDLFVDRRALRRRLQHRGHDQPQNFCAGDGAAFRRRIERRGIGVRRQRENGNRAIDGRGALRRREDRLHRLRDQRQIFLRERIGRARVPQQRRGLFERRAFGQRRRQHAAIDGTVFRDRRDGRIQHRQIGRLQSLSFDQRRAPVLETANILGAIAAAACAFRRRFGADQPAAHIGVERRRRDREFGRSLPGAQIKGLEVRIRFFHVD